jgi:4-oxalocrotonate tautomerase
MPFVNIRLVKELIADAPAKKKAAIGQRVADAISEITGLPPQEVWIVFEEVEARNWYLGTADVEMLRFRK